MLVEKVFQTSPKILLIGFGILTERKFPINIMDEKHLHFISSRLPNSVFPRKAIKMLYP